MVTGRDLFEVLSVIFSLFGSAALVFVIVWYDERRSSLERLDRAWPVSTRLVAVMAFGPLCLPVHFWRTRRTFLGVGLGLLLAAAVFAVDIGVSALLEAILT